MDLSGLQEVFKQHGCRKIFAKILAPNDNSKNQVYLGGSFDILNILPISDIVSYSPGDWKRERFKATFDYSWIRDDSNLYPAPKSQLILYPKYPEVRFSGFLAKCENPPSDLMTIRQAGRILFLSSTNQGKVIGYVTSPDSIIAKEFNSLELEEQHGVF